MPQGPHLWPWGFLTTSPRTVTFLGHAEMACTQAACAYKWHQGSHADVSGEEVPLNWVAVQKKPNCWSLHITALTLGCSDKGLLRQCCPGNFFSYYQVCWGYFHTCKVGQPLVCQLLLSEVLLSEQWANTWHVPATDIGRHQDTMSNFERFESHAV